VILELNFELWVLDLMVFLAGSVMYNVFVDIPKSYLL